MDKKRLVMCTSTGSIEYAPERYRNLGIEFFRIIVCHKGKEYKEGLDLDPYSFFKDLETLRFPEEPLPHSAMPSVEDIHAQYKSIIERGFEEVFIICLSSGLGGTYNLIKLIGEEYQDKLKIHVINALTTCFCEGLLAIQAQELVDKGVDSETILKELNWSIAHQEFLGCCGKLDYLIYNGRLKGGKAFMGKMLGIVPVMEFSRDGYIVPFKTVMGLKSAHLQCLQELKRRIGDRDPKDYILWLNYTGEHSADMFKQLEEGVGITRNHEDIIASPVVACHTGPYLSGYGLFMKRREDEPLE